MPLYKTITLENTTKVLIWKIEESYDELHKDLILTDICEQRVAKMKSEIHQRGFLSVRQLLKCAGYKPSDLYYDKNGKPHLIDNKYISISHSFEFSAIIISEIPVGIDVEMQRDKIQRIANKFVDYEWSYLNEHQLTQKLSVIWCIKESLYKVFATPGMSFKQHCKVIPFAIEENKTAAWIHYHSKIEKFEAHYIPIENFMCAFVLSLQ
ncbi:4'-phosphopantetheinyl transferase family protein [Zhouia sp. PK063]|uniref:4'-phosphopantetheinyl transferase family protein n=1 Tax=Zhouia sp. PK063 TaxID=3373602 RepID=UPI003798AB24